MFYPADATVPAAVKTDELLIRPLRAADVELDYDAVISSRAELLLYSGGRWPVEGFSLEENLADLVEHEQEHIARVAFTYTVMNPTETECLGCIYINPLASMLQRASGSPAQIAEVDDCAAWISLWVRHSRLADNLDVRLLSILIDWFKTEWAFQRVTFAARKEQARQIQNFTAAGLHLLFELPRSLVYTL